MSLSTKFRTVSCVAALLAFNQIAAMTAHADEATYLAHDASPCEIFRVLSHDIPGECRQTAAAPEGLRTRSIRFHAPVAASVVATATPLIETVPLAEVGQDVETVGDANELSLAMRIQFQFNSDVLTGEAKASLDSIAVVLNNDLMAEKVVMLEGHADASGSDDYNLSLSVRRARAVKAYLMAEHEIEDWRLPFTGKGETELYDRTTPTSSVNRRVEFINITG